MKPSNTSDESVRLRTVNGKCANESTFHTNHLPFSKLQEVIPFEPQPLLVRLILALMVVSMLVALTSDLANMIEQEPYEGKALAHVATILVLAGLLKEHRRNRNNRAVLLQDRMHIIGIIEAQDNCSSGAYEIKFAHLACISETRFGRIAFRTHAGQTLLRLPFDFFGTSRQAYSFISVANERLSAYHRST